ncbi:MAG: intradiol ring-cleavage dioxygenase, partial [Alphaproteobacteria bacterium]|nr:intradiol ring-cleavage dioxygenase [Alphaproteobacteria bacterium]
HFAVLPPGRPRFVTQMYVAGEPDNDRDILLRRMDAAARARLLVALAPAPDIETNALAGRFDIVIG